MTMKLPPELERMLNESGKPWCIVNGKRHRKLFFGDRMAMIAVLPKGIVRDAGGPRRMLLARVKRAIKEAQP